jgi:hypothetical protein
MQTRVFLSSNRVLRQCPLQIPKPVALSNVPRFDGVTPHAHENQPPTSPPPAVLNALVCKPRMPLSTRVRPCTLTAALPSTRDLLASSFKMAAWRGWRLVAAHACGGERQRSPRISDESCWWQCRDEQAVVIEVEGVLLPCVRASSVHCPSAVVFRGPCCRPGCPISKAPWTSVEGGVHIVMRC